MIVGCFFFPIFTGNKKCKTPKKQIMNRVMYVLLMAICWSCTQPSETEKHQNKRDQVVQVKDKIKEIAIEDVLMGSYVNVQLLDNYLIITDPRSYAELIHIFDKYSFNYVTSIAFKGEGPGEITNIGYIGLNETDRVLYVSDHGKQRIFTYPLDSVLANREYMPQVKMRMNEKQFPANYHYISDTLCIGSVIEPTGNYGFRQSVAKWNMETGEITPMPYTHPDIEKKRVSFAVSTKHGSYVECYSRHDLMTICTLDGELKYNVYGRKWSTETIDKIGYYGFVQFIGDYIFALYLGDKAFTEDEVTGVKGNLPTQFLVFNTQGDYIRTLETGYKVCDFCYDETNNRIIMSLDDEIQFAYLELDGIIDQGIR